MTLCDNPLWLLSHIRNSFVVSDETGNSGLVLDTAGETYASDQESVSATLGLGKDALKVAKTEGDDDDASLRPRSFEIRPGRGTQLMMAGYRPRCNTELKLEKMKRDKKNQKHVKTITWKSLKPVSDLPPEELEAMFPTKTPPSESLPPKSDTQKKSALSRLLDSCPPALPKNPFVQYSRLGLNPSEEKKGKEINIIYSMVSPNATVKRTKICINPAITVREVIGHICWIYTRDDLQPRLTSSNLDNFGLFLADTDGVVEYEMPSLESNECIAKYGFQILALVDLVELKTRRQGLNPSAPSPTAVTQAMCSEAHDTIDVILPDGTEVTVARDGSKTVRDVTDDLLSKFKDNLCQTKYHSSKYYMETEDKPGVAMDPNVLFQTYKSCSQFYVVREHSRRHSSSAGQRNSHNQSQQDEPASGAADSSFPIDSIDAAAYKEFHGLQMLMTKLKIRTDVVISVHNERVDVYPKKGGQAAAAAGAAVVPNRRSSSSGNVSGGSTSSVGGGPAAASKLVTSVVHSLGYKQESFNLDMVVDACVSHKPVPATDKIRHRVRLIVADGDPGIGAVVVGKYRKVDIEGDESTVVELHSKIEHLINWHSSKARADYLEATLTTAKKGKMHR